MPSYTLHCTAAIELAYVSTVPHRTRSPDLDSGTHESRWRCTSRRDTCPALALFNLSGVKSVKSRPRRRKFVNHAASAIVRYT